MGHMSESSGIFPECKMVIRGYFVILVYVKNVPINCQNIMSLRWDTGLKWDKTNLSPWDMEVLACLRPIFF